ncbi:MAG: glutamate synthase subunit alpha, partial [Polaromonas sp.]|nr:glutamate synthase subunit alpha [Polaromonas sp.]
GGTVAVLGKTGRNFAAGMSGGVAYVYDEDGLFGTRCNTSMVSMDRVVTSAEQQTHDKADWHADESDEELLKRLLQDHHRWTGSKRARELLDNWKESRLKFVKVFPNEYKRALLERKEARLLAATETTRTQVATNLEAVAAK